MPGEVSGTIRWAGWRGDYRERASGSLEIKQYPDNMPLVAFPPTDVNTLRVLLRPRSMSDSMAGLFFVDAYKERTGLPVDLILPFVPGARQDRLNDTGDYLFTAKSVAKEINARNFRSVTILDPHSEVTPALIDRCTVVHAHKCFEHLLAPEIYDAVVSPDAGAEKRAGGVAKKLGVPVLHAWKSRDVKSGQISGFGLEPTAGSGDAHMRGDPMRVLVVDDICDGGGTFLGLGEILAGRGIAADLYVTHGIFSQGTEKLLNTYTNIFCTDSVESNRPGVEVISICDRLLEEP